MSHQYGLRHAVEETAPSVETTAPTVTDVQRAALAALAAKYPLSHAPTTPEVGEAQAELLDLFEGLRKSANDELA